MKGRAPGSSSGIAQTGTKADPRAACAYCAIDFGTSNSAIALPGADGRVQLVEVEAGQCTMPTAVFYTLEGTAPHEEPRRLYGRAAVAAYIDGMDGRLMRSMKSILGSPLADRSTDVGAGRSVPYLDVIAGYLRHLVGLAHAKLGGQAAAPLTRAVLGRPVFFVDGDAERDAQAQATLQAAAQAVGLRDVSFQFEPIAAALDYESGIDREELVLVADIGGGTSDFSLVRVGPARRVRVDRHDDILASHGVHVAGTDFDRHVELAAILPLAGFRSVGPPPAAREVPSGIYFDLATWHLINSVYVPARIAELRRMRTFYADARLHQRLLTIVEDRLGHALMAAAEAAKIQVAEGAQARIDLAAIEPGLAADLSQTQALAAVDADVQRIADAALETLRQAGVRPQDVDVLYLTGGSTGLRPLTDRIAAGLPNARTVRGDRLASVAQGLGLHAQRVFGPG